MFMRLNNCIQIVRCTHPLDTRQTEVPGENAEAKRKQTTSNSLHTCGNFAATHIEKQQGELKLQQAPMSTGYTDRPTMDWNH